MPRIHASKLGIACGGTTPERCDVIRELHRLGDELRSVVGPDVSGNAPQDEVGQNVDHIDRPYPDNEQSIATHNLRRKMARNQAEHAPAYHRKAETSAAAGVFFSGPRPSRLNRHNKHDVFGWIGLRPRAHARHGHSADASAHRQRARRLHHRRRLSRPQRPARS
jgi:hypothetical protein